VKKVFADASYWVALLSPHDQLHRQVKQLEGLQESFYSKRSACTGNPRNVNNRRDPAGQSAARRVFE